MKTVVKKFSELTADELFEIMRIRVSVFVVEQNCPYQELDEFDKSAIHMYLEDKSGIVAYLRLMDKSEKREFASIGRVLCLRRREGLATKLLSQAIETAKEQFGADKIYLEAQTYARGLYEKLGFKQISEEFLEDGIPHIKMLLEM